MKFKEIHEEKYEGPAIYAIWHANQYLYLAKDRNKRPYFNLLISPSNDGDMIAKVCRQMNFSLIRGSTKRQGMLAIRDMAKSFKKGQSVAYTVDGPKGPAIEVKEGLIRIAQMTQVPIIPLMGATKHKFIFDSWDKYELPYWFSGSVAMFGKPVFIPKNATEDDLENYRVIIENRLIEMKNQAEEELKKK
ncbi:MAG: DUF374 domain-containing protein [Candidatus Gastranaerophilales bacterium]|nr:DUF374 domain-containing protein [Candidatus Gastranaerophilales bacterium]